MKNIILVLIFILISDSAKSEDFPRLSLKNDDAFPILSIKQENRKEDKPIEKQEPKINWFEDYSIASEEVSKTNKPIFILFTDPISCIPCQRLEAGALKEKDVILKLNTFVCLRVKTNEAYGLNLAKRFNVNGWPTMVIYKSGKWVKTHLGEYNKDEMIEFLDIEKGK